MVTLGFCLLSREGYQVFMKRKRGCTSCAVS